MSGGTTLADHVELQVGFAFKSSAYTSDPTHRRLLRGDNIAQGVTRWNGAVCVAPTEVVDERYDLEAGDVVIAMDRPWIGAGLKFATVGQADLPALLVQRVARLRARSGTDQRYLHYLVAGHDFTNHILAVQTGTAIPHVSGSQILRYRVDTKSLSEQRAIAEVLGALDDKIEANARLSRTCVELADAIFLAAAGGANLRAQVFGDVASIGGGGTPRTNVENYWNGDVLWATPTDVTALRGPYLSSTARMITGAGLESCSSPLYPEGSILMTSRATIGAFAVAQRRMAVNQGFIVVNAHDERLQWWLFHEMRRRVPEFVTHANGATFLELSRGKFKQFHVHLTDLDSMIEFGVTADVLHGRARAALEENERLAHTRDTLLPLLMSGKLRVKDAEKAVEEVL